MAPEKEITDEPTEDLGAPKVSKSLKLDEDQEAAVARWMERANCSKQEAILALGLDEKHIQAKKDLYAKARAEGKRIKRKNVVI